MDNGREFANSEMRELGNKLGISIKHTAAYAPWANGINERNHATIDTMMDTMLEKSPGLSEQTALQYATSIRNSMMYVKGFTPSQLSIGQNPRLPSNITDNIPALSEGTTSPVVSEYLHNLDCARKAFVSMENSAKLRKALRKPVRSYCDSSFVNGDQVFYKLPNEKRWQGPATVIGQDSKVVLIRHGSIMRRVHPCRLLHVNSEQGSVPCEGEISETSVDIPTDEAEDSNFDEVVLGSFTTSQ